MPETKPTNPKDAIGIKKVPMSCLSSQAVSLVARAFAAEALDTIMEEMQQGEEVTFSTQFDAAVAHLMNFWEGVNDYSEPHHLARAMARIMLIRHAEMSDLLNDDRSRYSGLHVHGLNAQAATIIEKYQDCVDPYTELGGKQRGEQLPVVISATTPFHLLPWRVVMEMALGMMEGGRKYGRHNYRKVGVRASVYYDATIRHLADAVEGTSVDKDSGLSHLSKALSSSQVLLDSMIMGNWVDDRPLRIVGEKTI